MQLTDPVADMLTRIRNASSAGHDAVDVPSSKLKKAITEILVNEGFIKSYHETNEGHYSTLHLVLKYHHKRPVIQGLKRISRSGLRVYAKSTELPSVLNGLGIAIVTTSEGVMTDKEARAKKLGGEVLAYVW
ncbi:MAG: 30S ribosomal protein S8 [Eubacteriales bacterium]|nr:30S ribosomal protein S8 [Eubacteriales bacterium]